MKVWWNAMFSFGCKSVGKSSTLYLCWLDFLIIGKLLSTNIICANLEDRIVWQVQRKNIGANVEILKEWNHIWIFDSLFKVKDYSNLWGKDNMSFSIFYFYHLKYTMANKLWTIIVSFLCCRTWRIRTKFKLLGKHSTEGLIEKLKVVSNNGSRLTIW